MKITKNLMSIVLLLVLFLGLGASASANGFTKHNGKIVKHGHMKKKKCENFFFDALGDFVYFGGPEEDAIQHLIDDVINQEKPAFVVHIGDFQNSPKRLGLPGSVPIALIEEQMLPHRDFWWQIKAPFIVTPGDNDWFDTIVSPRPGPIPGTPPFPPNPDPIGTLNAFRDVWYEQGTNAKFPFKVISQPEEFPEFSDYIENKRWSYNKILFVTIHTIAGNNGLVPPDSVFEEARQAIINEASGPTGRIAANLAWLNKAFDVAERQCARGLVIITHADPDFDFESEEDPVVSLEGYASELKTIRDRSVANIPNHLQVLFIYGGTHIFKVNKPFPLLGEYPPYDFIDFVPGQTFVPNLTAVVVPGSSRGGLRGPSTGPGRVKINVNFDSPGLFEIYSSLTTQ